MIRRLFGLAVLSCTSAFASPVVYTERAEFEAAVPGLPVEGFEVPFDDASTVHFSGFTVGEDSSFAIVKSRTDYVSEGERSLGFTWNGEGNLLFTFDPPIDAFAADILDFGTCCGATFLDATNETGEWTVTAATGEDRPRGNLQFFGIVAETPFSEIAFTSDVVSDNDLIVFDEVAIRPGAGAYGDRFDRSGGLLFPRFRSSEIPARSWNTSFVAEVARLPQGRLSIARGTAKLRRA